MSENETADLLSGDERRIFTFKFTDGIEADLTDCSVRVDESGARECVATIVRSEAEANGSPGEAICFALSDVADVQVARDGFKYHR